MIISRIFNNLCSNYRVCFRSDGRKSRWLSLVSLCLLLCALLAGCSAVAELPTVYSTGDFHISLPKGFRDDSDLLQRPGQGALFSNDEMSVFALREEPEECAALEDYARRVMEERAPQAQLWVERESGRFIYFAYESEQADGSYFHTVVVYEDESEGSFWQVTFSCRSESRAAYEERFISLAAQVVIGEMTKATR